jgi:hypothetical protein
METIEIDFIAGPSPGWLAPLLHLPVREAPDVLAIFMRGTDIVVRRRSRSADLRLAVPSVTFGGALDGVGPGDTASLVLDLNGGRYRLTVDSTVVTRPLHSARGWSIWYDALGASDRLRTLLDLAWITLLLGPIGYWATSWWGAASGLVPLGATAMAPLLTPVALPSVGYFFCGALALGLGRLTRRLGTIRRSA